MGFGNDKRKPGRLHRFLLWVPEPIRCVSMVSFFRFLALCLLVAFFCLGIFFFDEVKEHSLECLEWIRSLGFLYGSIALCIVNILGAMLFLPCLPFTLASGEFLLYLAFFDVLCVYFACLIGSFLMSYGIVCVYASALLFSWIVSWDYLRLEFVAFVFFGSNIVMFMFSVSSF